MTPRIAAGLLATGFLLLSGDIRMQAEETAKAPESPKELRQKALNEALSGSVALGDTDLATKCLQLGAQCEQTRNHPGSPLHQAAINGDAAMIETLLKHGADPNFPDQIGQPASYAAFIWWADGSPGWVKCLDLLREAGCDFNKTGKDKSPLLFEAVSKGNPAMLQAVLRGKPDFRMPNEYGETAQEVAAKAGKREIYEMMIEAGADRPTGLHAASGLGEVETVKKLLSEGADPNAPDQRKRSPVYHAAVAGQNEVLKVLLENGADITKTGRKGVGDALTMAACEGHTDTVATLLKAGADPNAPRGGRPANAMIAAAWNGHLPLLKLLHEAGGKVNFAMIYAADKGQTEVVDYLLSLGADPLEIKEKDWQKNALIQATKDGHAATVELLLKKAGDRFDQEDKNLALRVAASRLSGLASANHPRQEKEKKDRHIETIKVLARNGSQIPGEKDEYLTALMSIIMTGDTDLVEWVLDTTKADPSVTDGRNVTAFHDAMNPFYSTLAKTRIPIVKSLIGHGLNIDQKQPVYGICGPVDKDKVQPIFLLTTMDNALMCPGPDNREVVRILLSHGATFQTGSENGEALMNAVAQGEIEEVRKALASTEVDQKANNGWTAYLLASALGEPEIAKVLLEAGANPSALTTMGMDHLTLAANSRNPDMIRLAHQATPEGEREEALRKVIREMTRMAPAEVIATLFDLSLERAALTDLSLQHVCTLMHAPAAGLILDQLQAGAAKDVAGHP